MIRRRRGADEPDWEALGVHPSELLDDDRSETVAGSWADGGLRWNPLPADELTWLSVIVTEPFEPSIRPGLSDRSARRWWRSVGDQLIGAALQYSAADYEVIERPWGMVFEVGFTWPDRAEAFRNSEALSSAIDQLGSLRLEVAAGRGGGGAAVRSPRRGRPLIGAGGAEVPLPEHRSSPAGPAPSPLVGQA